jgi:nucleotide-binding universal stress UspA family protein
MHPSTARRSTEAPMTPGTLTRGPIVVAAKGAGDVPLMRAAHLLAELTGADVRVVSALEPELGFMLPDDLPLPAAYERDRVSVRLRALEGEMLGVLDASLPLWPTEVRTGDPSRVIADVASESSASLVVMGIGRQAALERLLAAETTIRTVAHVSQPVLAVAADFHELPRAAVAGTDFGPASLRAIELALELLEAPATIHVVHVWPRLDTYHELLRKPLLEQERLLPARLDQLRVALPEREQVTVSVGSVVGTPAEALTREAVARGAELLVVGRTARRRLERLLGGSVSSAVLRAAIGSVLVVPEPSPADADRLEHAVWGTSESRDPQRWVTQLDGFTRRNAGRRTVLEVDDPALGAQAQATGYALLGATYDRHDRRVQLMLGGPEGATHLTRSIEDVRSVAVRAPVEGSGETLRVLAGTTQVLLTVAP